MLIDDTEKEMRMMGARAPVPSSRRYGVLMRRGRDDRAPGMIQQGVFLIKIITLVHSERSKFCYSRTKWNSPRKRVKSSRRCQRPGGSLCDNAEHLEKQRDT